MSERLELSLLSRGVIAEGFIIFIFGDLVILWRGAKRPKFASHWKYLFPLTDPSFLPRPASNSMPAHSPAANSVGPRYLRVPVLVPAIVEATMTRSPTSRGPEAARLDVDSAGETVGETEAPFLRSAVLATGLGAPTRDWRLRLEMVSAATTDCFLESLLILENTPWFGGQLK